MGAVSLTNAENFWFVGPDFIPYKLYWTYSTSVCSTSVCTLDLVETWSNMYAQYLSEYNVINQRFWSLVSWSFWWKFCVSLPFNNLYLTYAVVETRYITTSKYQVDAWRPSCSPSCNGRDTDVGSHFLVCIYVMHIRCIRMFRIQIWKIWQSTASYSWVYLNSLFRLQHSSYCTSDNLKNRASVMR